LPWGIADREHDGAFAWSIRGLLLLQNFDLVSGVAVGPGSSLATEQSSGNEQGKRKGGSFHKVSPDWQLPAG
jgi:hypothetical protein